MEFRVRDWYKYMVKLLGFFFSIFSELFGGFIFRVKVYLVESEKVIFVK